MAYLDGNGVQVQEVTLGQPSEADIEMLLNDEAGEGMSREDAIEYLSNDDGATPTKYGQYTLPGGENYREVLLTLPAKITRDNKYEVRQSESAEFPFLLWNTETDKQMSRHRTEAEAQRYKEAGNNRTDHTAAFYKSSHWDTSNVLAHVRLNDRVDSDGKRVLFVEEIQSDWGQQGKKEGFNDMTPTLQAEYDKLVQKFRGDRTDSENARVRELEAMGANSPKPRIPSAPFVNKTEGWLNLA